MRTCILKVELSRTFNPSPIAVLVPTPSTKSPELRELQRPWKSEQKTIATKAPELIMKLRKEDTRATWVTARGVGPMLFLQDQMKPDIHEATDRAGLPGHQSSGEAR